MNISDLTPASAEASEITPLTDPNWEHYAPPADHYNTTLEEVEAAKFTFGTKVLYRDLPGTVVRGSANLPTLPWWSIPVCLEADSGFIQFLHWSTLELVEPPVTEVIEGEVVSVHEYQESGVFRCYFTGHIWANTVKFPEIYHCLTSPFLPLEMGVQEGWYPLYKKVRV